MVCFDIDDVEEYNINNNLMTKYNNIDNLIKNNLTLKYKDNDKLLECIKIMYYLLKNNKIIEDGNIYNYIYPSSEVMTLKVLIECSNETEKIHIDNLKIGDIIERNDEGNKQYYKIVKLDELNVFFRKVKINKINDKKITIINTQETNKKTEIYKKSLVSSIFYEGVKKLNNDKHLIKVKPLIFKNVLCTNN